MGVRSLAWCAGEDDLFLEKPDADAVAEAVAQTRLRAALDEIATEIEKGAVPTRNELLGRYCAAPARPAVPVVPSPSAAPATSKPAARRRSSVDALLAQKPPHDARNGSETASMSSASARSAGRAAEDESELELIEVQS